MLYEAVCAQSNNYVAHQVCKHIDEKQLMYCIQNPCKNIELLKPKKTLNVNYQFINKIYRVHYAKDSMIY